MRSLLLPCLSVAVAIAACSDQGPFDAGFGAFDFEIVAPARIPNKQVVQVEARVVRTGLADYPLTFVYEKANAGEDFYGVGAVILWTPDERVARLGIPILADPVIRVTPHDSSGAPLSVSRTVRIDVLDYR